MIYYPRGMELEVVSELFRGRVNDAVVCRDRLSASGEMYTLLIVHNREYAMKLLGVLEDNTRDGTSPCIMSFAQNDKLIFMFPYREERKLSSFVKGQITDITTSETIAVNLVMECLSVALPWPLLHLVLEQELVNINKDNTVYFTMNIDLEKLDPEVNEKKCVSDCVWMLMEILDAPIAGKHKRKKQSKSLELIRKKSTKGAYTCLPELYQDIRFTAIIIKESSLARGFKGFWKRNRDRFFKILFALCIALVVVALLMLITKLIFGDIPWLRLFENRFDVIGTQDLHRGVGI